MSGTVLDAGMNKIKHIPILTEVIVLVKESDSNQIITHINIITNGESCYNGSVKCSDSIQKGNHLVWEMREDFDDEEIFKLRAEG